MAPAQSRSLQVQTHMQRPWGRISYLQQKQDALTTQLVPKFFGESQGAQFSAVTLQVQDPAQWGGRSRAVELLWCRYTGTQR